MAFISIDDEEAKKFRKALLNGIGNHPHDCQFVKKAVAATFRYDGNDHTLCVAYRFKRT